MEKTFKCLAPWKKKEKVQGNVKEKLQGNVILMALRENGNEEKDSLDKN